MLDVPLWIMLLSTEGDPSSMFWRLFFPGDKGVATPCGRLSLTGLSSTLAVVSFMLSMATGSSFAPGGTVFLLGLPCGVLTGVVKLLALLPLVGVVGRPSFFSCCFPPGKKLDMKLAILCALRRRCCAEWWISAKANLAVWMSSIWSQSACRLQAGMDGGVVVDATAMDGPGFGDPFATWCIGRAGAGAK